MASFCTIPLRIRNLIYLKLLNVSPLWISPIWTITHYYEERPIPLLKGQSLFLVSRQISLEARAILYGSNKFLLETNELPEIQEFLIGIGPTNRSFLNTLSIDFCGPINGQGHFADLEYTFYQINMPEDSDSTPEELRASLQKTERYIKNTILDNLRLLSGAGKQNLNDLSLMIPGDDQGRLMLYRYENDFYYRGDLLEDEEMRTAIRDMGPVEKLSIGRTESKELAMSLAKEMGVKELKVRWFRAYFEQEEEIPGWNTGGWVQDEDFLGAKIGLMAAQEDESEV